MHKHSSNKKTISFPSVNFDFSTNRLNAVYIISRNDNYLPINPDILAELNLPIKNFWSLGRAMYELPMEQGNPVALIVDVDSVGGLHCIFDQLWRTRTRHPEVVVLLLSRHFKSDDYSLERLPICDVSLINDTLELRIYFALAQAIRNNQEWLKRRAHIDRQREPTTYTQEH
jgi:hypothetical protein